MISPASFRWLCSLIIALVSVQPCLAAETLTFTLQGVERTVLLHQPPAASSDPRPLVIALHGNGQNVDGLRSWVRLDAAAEREEFIVAYPSAVDLKWNYGRPINDPMPTASGEPVDDVAFIRHLIDDLVSRKLADPARIYVIGVSRGGLMTFTLACVLADQIAAVAPLITGMTEYQRDDCRPSRSVPIMMIAGTADRVQSFGGGLGKLGRLLSVPDSVKFWREMHSCVGPVERSLPHRDPDDATHVRLLVWSRCQTEPSVRVYRVVGGGHQPPSIALRASPQLEQRMGLRNRDVEAADEVWAFFKQFRR